MDNFIQITVFCPASGWCLCLQQHGKGPFVQYILLLFLFLPKERAKNNEGKGLIDLTEFQETRDMQ